MPPFDYKDAYPQYGEGEDTLLRYPFISKEISNSIFPNRFRKREGIIQECCDSPCSIWELYSYCK